MLWDSVLLQNICGFFFAFSAFKFLKKLTVPVHQPGKYDPTLGFLLDGRHRDDCLRHTILLPLKDFSENAYSHEQQEREDKHVIC
jgi:hypothetical protein